VPILKSLALSKPVSLLDNVNRRLELPNISLPARTSMARMLLKIQRQQAKGQLIRWKQDLRYLVVKEVSAV